MIPYWVEASNAISVVDLLEKFQFQTKLKASYPMANSVLGTAGIPTFKGHDGKKYARLRVNFVYIGNIVEGEDFRNFSHGIFDQRFVFFNF